MGPHFGEEPSFSGIQGSGTVFFSGCSGQCFFCQNYQISIQHAGSEYSQEKFLEEVKSLIRKGVHNINFVTPDHFWPHIKTLCRSLREEGLKIPMIFNSSGYQKAELIEDYAEDVDIFLPDFKFSQKNLAQRCMGDERYPEIALKAIHAMVQAKGLLKPWDPSGKKIATQGVLVRHLVLPGQVENSLEVLRVLYRSFGEALPLAVMSQFRPVGGCFNHQDFGRVLRTEEYEQVLELVERLGFKHVYTQELKEETDFLPDFQDPENPFPGNRLKKTD